MVSGTVRSARCKVQGARCGVRGARCKVRGARCKVQGARCEVLLCIEYTYTDNNILRIVSCVYTESSVL